MVFQDKETIIREYISNIDFSKDDWSYRRIQSDLKNLLGESPAIDLTYKKDVLLNEFNSEAKEVQIIDTISIVFSPDLDNSFKRITFEVNKTL